ncbi:hypothetical protein QYF36_018005 [Acer negundo]|nr:hypothetical protein QYF36_018005 [Acer negundo]
MRFKVGDSWVCMACNLSLHSPVTFKVLARSFQIEKYGVMLELCVYVITTAEMQYKLRAANKVADALSRRGVDSDLSLSAFSVANFVDTATLRHEKLAGPVLGVIIQNIREGTLVRDGYVLKDDLLLFKG